jgi:hypothetical protein
MPEQNGRYTPKRSVEALRQKYLAVSPTDARLDTVRRQLAIRARYGPRAFAQAVRELISET